MDDPELERLKREVSIVDLVRAAGLTIVKRGRWLSTKEHDSLMLWTYRGHNDYWWYSQGHGGSVIDWLVNTQRVTVKEAIELLKRHAGSDYQVRPAYVAPAVEPPPPPLSNDLPRKFHASLGANEQRWWEDRGIFAGARDQFILGACDHPRYGRCFSIPVYEDGALVNIRLRLKYPRNPKDKYRPWDEGRGTHLYNCDVLTPDLHAVVVCAGELKCVTLWTFGVPAISPTGGCGQHWRPEWLTRLKHCRTIYLAYDPGEEAAAKQAAEQIGARARIVVLDEKPDDYILHRGRDAFRFALRTAYRLQDGPPATVKVASEVADALFAPPAPVSPQVTRAVPWRKQLWQNGQL